MKTIKYTWKIQNHWNVYTIYIIYVMSVEYYVVQQMYYWLIVFIRTTRQPPTLPSSRAYRKYYDTGDQFEKIIRNRCWRSRNNNNNKNKKKRENCIWSKNINKFYFKWCGKVVCVALLMCTQMTIYFLWSINGWTESHWLNEPE